MPKSLLMSLVLAVGLGGAALAQSPDTQSAGGYGDAMPSLILPPDMTSPTLSGADDSGQSATNNPDQSDSYEPEPYSVEGEETLDPGGN